MFIKSLHLKNILSFRDTKLDLQPLNVLIGPNGSGKSNLIDVIALLQAVPGDLPAFLRRNGPTGEWVWKGEGSSAEAELSALEIGAVLDTENLPAPLEYQLGLTVIRSTGHFDVTSESLTMLGFSKGLPAVITRNYQEATISNGGLFESAETASTLSTADFTSRGRSTLNEIRDSFNYPIVTDTARRLSATKIYRNWDVGRDSPVRHPQRTDGDPNFLEEDFSNLALVVNDLLSRKIDPSLNDYLGRFYESYESLHPRIFGNTIELIVNEAGMSSPLPASRLSDGTIRFIALLAILCHPEPPPLICIEEPEIAMHPDSQDLVVQLLKQASERTQLIVATHSPWLIDRLSAVPEQVVVCERDRHPDKGTQFKRFTREDLEDWLEDQTLGEVWMAGAMGGVH